MKAFLKGKGQTQRLVLSVPVCIRYAEWANPQREKADSGLQGWGVTAPRGELPFWSWILMAAAPL